MAKLLILYGTTEGQTAKIAHHVADTARTRGVEVDTVHGAEVGDDLDLEAYDAAIVAASLHEGHHQRYVRKWVAAHRDWLTSHPSAFISVSLSSAAGTPEGDKGAQECIDAFCHETGWHPQHVAPVAGALRYTQYSWLKRILMKQISKQAGGDTDTTHDFEYTDWDGLTEFTSRFLAAHGLQSAGPPTIESSPRS